MPNLTPYFYFLVERSGEYVITFAPYTDLENYRGQGKPKGYESWNVIAVRLSDDDIQKFYLDYTKGKK